MTFLLEHLPPNVHLVISTRSDPILPLRRLRARDYLTGVPGLNLDAPDIATLEDRTEGWIAALQLAALSMQGREEVGGFIAASPEMTGTSSTTWSRRFWGGNPLTSATSWSVPQSWTGSAARCATR